jgi:hypothetical protein
MVRIVSEIQPEEFTRDLLGNIFHSLIPLEVRKPVAAYYTNPMAARLLAKLAINDQNATVADFACGSGTLLMSAYERKEELLDHPFSLETHRQFIENDITGIDIMPFAAHLAVVQLALKNPSYLTDKVRIGVRDSTGLKPGDRIKVLQRVLPRGQQVLSTFNETSFKKSFVNEGALSARGGGQEFRVQKVDVVIMNPPFTRQEKIPHDFKSDLQKRFREYNDFIDPQMGLRAYFILLADRFLKPNGVMAFVLPATTVRVESMRGVRDFLTKNYAIEYILATDYRSAFSESTSLREILLIARKKGNVQKEQESCIVANLKVLPTKENISYLEKILINSKTIDNASFKSEFCSIYKIEQAKLAENIADWSVLMPSEQTLDKLIEAFSELENVCPLREMINPKDFKRCDYPSIMYIAWERDARTQEKGNILKVANGKILSRSKLTGIEVNIPISATLNALWALSGISFIDFTNKEDKIISSPFPDCECYFNSEVTNIFRKWGTEKLQKYMSDFFVPRKIDLAASGTAHLAIRTENPSVPSTSIWGLGRLGQRGKFLALFFHSTLGVTLMLRKRIEVRGSWSQFSKETLLSLPVPNFYSFDKKTRKDLLDLYNSVTNKPFPSLIEQFSSSFEELVKIDKAFFKLLGLEEYEKESAIRELHRCVSKELEQLKEMMERD